MKEANGDAGLEEVEGGELVRIDFMPGSVGWLFDAGGAGPCGGSVNRKEESATNGARYAGTSLLAGSELDWLERGQKYTSARMARKSLNRTPLGTRSSWWWCP